MHWRHGFLVLLTLVAAPLAAADRPEPTVYRAEAGELEADGWCTARSTGGEFSVRLPSVFNDLSTPGLQAGQKIFVVSADTADKHKFVAMRFPHKKFFRDADDYFAEMSKDTEVKRVKNKKRHEFDGRPALDLRIESPKGETAVMQHVFFDDESIMLTIFQEGETKIRPADAKKFFNSLEIEKPNAEQQRVKPVNPG